MAEDLNMRIADRLVELAFALDDKRLPLEARAAFVKRELAMAAKELLDARGVQPSEPEHLLLVHAERTYTAPYCAKLAGPCPDGCAGVKVQCGRPGELHGDCWRVKQPSISGVDTSRGSCSVCPICGPVEPGQVHPKPGCPYGVGGIDDTTARAAMTSTTAKEPK